MIKENRIFTGRVMKEKKNLRLSCKVGRITKNILSSFTFFVSLTLYLPLDETITVNTRND